MILCIPTFMIMISSRKTIAFLGLLALAIFLSACQSTSRRAEAEAERDQRAQVHMDDAQRFLDQGLTDSALAAFGLALEENPRLTEARVGMGQIYIDKGDYSLAEEALERAAEIDPNSFDAQYYLGLSKQLLGRVKEAIRIYLKALAIDPDDFDANNNLAGAYLQDNKPDLALPYAVRAVELDAESEGAWANLAAVYSLTGDYEEAVQAYRQAVELGNMPEPVLLGLADAHIRLKNYQLAMNVLRRMIRENASSTAYERLGYCQFKLRRFDDALASFRAALSVDENDTAALNGLGVCLMTLYLQSEIKIPSQRDAALEAWRKSVSINGGQPKILDLLSRYQ